MHKIVWNIVCCRDVTSVYPLGLGGVTSGGGTGEGGGGPKPESMTSHFVVGMGSGMGVEGAVYRRQL